MTAIGMDQKGRMLELGISDEDMAELKKEVLKVLLTQKYKDVVEAVKKEVVKEYKAVLSARVKKLLEELDLKPVFSDIVEASRAKIMQEVQYKFDRMMGSEYRDW